MKTEGYGYVVGVARLKSANPITQMSRLLLVCISFDPETGRIVDAEIDGVLRVTTRFLQDILVERSLYHERDDILQEINNRYSGASRAMLAIAVKDAYNKVMNRRKN